MFLDTANDTWIHLCVPGFKKDEDNVFFDCMIVFQENQLEPMDGRKGLTSGWIFLIGLYLFKEIFSKGWEEGENGGWKLEG